MKKSIIIIDDHPIVSFSLKLLFERDDDIEVTLATDDNTAAIQHLRNNGADLVILDIELPGADGFQVMKQIQHLDPRIKVLFLSSKKESVYASRAFMAGASGFISKEEGMDRIAMAAKSILAGYTAFSPQALQAARTAEKKGLGSAVPLTDREISIVRHLISGLSNKDIGERLFISNKTVSAHKANIYAKLGIHSVAELIAYANDHDLL
ncbi:response regulator [Jeongeupia sp. USM3]|uniref:response regulator n=1 Tax=Jeongeupia sp. USM3 TaxID=1906741 RepID=UPI00089E0304|nr:response regulator [Jeongeupia sp. USM3]AOY00027.1 DNA-binding response regulator [Jeongeupia sp. USM3]